MKQIRVLMLVMLCMMGVVMFGVGCNLGESAHAESGTLLIQMREEGVSRNLFSTETDLDMDIASYKIRIFPGGEIRKLVEEYIYHMEADASSVVIEALRPGNWMLEIEGWNDWDAENEDVSGSQIAYLKSRGEGGRYIPFPISRGRVTQVAATEAVLIPIVNGEGNLTIIVDLSAVAESGMVHDPNVSVTIEQINDYFQHYTVTPWGDPSTTTETRELVSPEEEKVFGHQFSGLPAGWYKVTAEITSTAEENPNVVQLTRIGFVRVVSDNIFGDPKDYPVTTGTFTITDTTSFVTGSLDLTISEEMDPLSITLAGDESILYGNADGFGDTVTSGGYTVTVEGASSGNTLSYAWYVNGDEILSADADEESFEFAESGQYTVTVVVWEKDASLAYVNWGSASQEVSVVKQLAVERSSLEIVDDDPTSTVTMTVTADGNEITGSPYTCEWSVKDGEGTEYVTEPQDGTGTLTIDLGAGTYTFTVTVQDEDSIAEGEYIEAVEVVGGAFG